MLRLMKLLTGNVSRTIDQVAKEMGITPRKVNQYIEIFARPAAICYINYA